MHLPASFPALLLVLQAVATFAMTGLVWFVQVVHYPLFALIPDPHHSVYASQHQTRTGWVVAPLMLVELATGLVALRGELRPAAVTFASATAGTGFLVVIWLSTASLQIPMHSRLLHGLQQSAVSRLVRTNWLRTAAWTIRSALMAWWLWLLASQASR